MARKHPEIKLTGLQVKSLKKAKLLAKALAVIEEECGIKEVRITMADTFVCPWIDLMDLDKTEMEALLFDLLSKNRGDK